MDSVQVAKLYKQNVRLTKDFDYYSSYEHVYALDTVRCPGFALLTLYRVDESGFHDLYYLTLDSTARRVRQAILVAAWGGDGSGSGEATMQRLGNRLRVTTISETNDEASSEQYDIRITDSRTTVYHLTPAGVVTANASRQQPASCACAQAVISLAF